jgi:hypothetical protein
LRWLDRGSSARKRLACPLVTIDLDQTLVADSEVVCDLVEHDAPHLLAKDLRVVSVDAYERAAEDRDLVGEYAGVVAAASGERDPW